MKTYNVSSVSYRHEKSSCYYGESAGYKIKNSDRYLVYLYPTAGNKGRESKIFIVNDDEYYMNKLTFNLG